MTATTVTKRGKTGCITCRIRRVRCDEGKPDCHRCISTGRKCDGYSGIPFTRRELHAASQLDSVESGTPYTIHEPVSVSRLMTDPSFDDLLEKRYFQFFRQKTVVDTNLLVDSRFWDRVILQTCHSEPAIKHAVLALSSWHQATEDQTDNTTRVRHQNYSAKQYQLALTHAQQLVSSAQSEDIERVLITCIICICYEFGRGEYKAGHIHMNSARAIERQHAYRLRHASRRNDLFEINQALARLDVSSLCFSVKVTPLHYTLHDFYQVKPYLVPWEFKTVYEAQASMVDLMRWMLIIVHNQSVALREQNAKDMFELQAEKNRCAQSIREWQTHFEAIIDKAGQVSELMGLYLRQWHAGATVLIKTEEYGPETQYDACLDQFQSMVSISEKIHQEVLRSDPLGSFSCELGYIVGAYVAAIRCRDPMLRRHAIHILNALPRQEGAWSSKAAAAIAERWVEIEEEDLGTITTAADIPEHRRIRDIDAAIFTQDGFAEISYQTLSSHDEHGSIGPVDSRQEIERRELVRWR